MNLQEVATTGLHMVGIVVVNAAGGAAGGAAWSVIAGAAFVPSVALFTIYAVSGAAMTILIEKIAPKESHLKLHITINLLCGSLLIGAMIIAGLSLGVFGTTAAVVYSSIGSLSVGFSVIMLGYLVYKDNFNGYGSVSYG